MKPLEELGFQEVPRPRLEVPAELHGIACSPALPAIPAVVFTGKEPISGRMNYQLLPPVGGHSILDLYFCAIIGNMTIQVPEGEDLDAADAPDAILDRLTRLAWRLAISAVRTRPATGPVPAGIPKEGLK